MGQYHFEELYQTSFLYESAESKEPMTKTVSFIFSSDWHLSFGTWGKHPSLTGDPYAALHEIVDKHAQAVLYDIPQLQHG